MKNCLCICSLVIKLTAWTVLRGILLRGILPPFHCQGRFFVVHDTSVLNYSVDNFSVENGSKDSSGLCYGV